MLCNGLASPFHVSLFVRGPRGRKLEGDRLSGRLLPVSRELGEV